MKIVNRLNSVAVFEKSSILDIRLCSEYASEFSCKRNLGEPIALIDMKNKQKIKTLLNFTDVVNVEQWAKI